MIELRAGAVTCLVSPDDGGRLASLVIDGTEILVCTPPDPTHPNPMMWGCFPMAPWAGRIRRGLFVFDGREYQMPINMPPHSIHGTAFTRRWALTEASEVAVTMTCALDDPWPFGGVVEHHIELSDDEIACELSIIAADHAMPVSLGWHPWFVKPEATTLRFARMYQRDVDGIPTGELVESPPPPWDDCFIEPLAPITLEFDEITVTLTSDCDHWVLYDQPVHAMCVEPQSGPPDAFTLEPRIVAPGQRFTRSMAMWWSDTN